MLSKNKTSAFRLFSVLVLLIFHWNVRTHAQIIHTTFDKITVKDGLSHSTGTHIIQDKTGFIWFATYYGINRYDGHNIRTYINNPLDSTSLSHNGVLHMLEDDSGYIWIVNVSETTGLDRYNPEKDNFTKFAHDPGVSTSISSNNIQHLMQDTKGNIWICTNNALNQVIWSENGDSADLHFKRFYYPSDTTEITWAYEDKNGHLLLFADHLLYFFNRKTKTFENTQVKLPGSRVTSVAEDKAGDLYVGTQEDGIVKLRYDANSMKYRRAPLGKLAKCSGNQNVIVVDEKNQIWVGTENSGLYKFNQSENRLVNYVHDPTDPGSLSDNFVFSLNIDRTGILWIGTRNKGICKYDLYSKQFIHFKAIPGNEHSLSNNIITGIDGNKSDELWVATADGVNRILFNQNGNTRFIDYKNMPDNENSIASNNTLSLVHRKNGNVWVGSNTGFMSVITPENPASGNSARIERLPVESWTFTLFEDSEGTIWGGTWGGGLWRYSDETGQFTYFKHDPTDPLSICENIIWAIGEDKHKNIWIGGNSEGLSILPAGDKYKSDPDFINFKFDQNTVGSLSNNTIHTIYQDSAGTMWIGTSGGLNKMVDKDNYFEDFQGDKPEFVVYTTSDGLPSDGIIGIEEDENGNLCIATANGISIFNFPDSIFINYFESDGLQGNEFGHNAFYKNPDGRIFFGGVNGISAFDPQSIKANPFKPEIVITDLKLSNQSVGIDEKINNDIILTKAIHLTSEITLSHKNNRISIDFAALHYAQPSKNQFAYRLEGFEEEWNYVDNQYSVSYTNLDAGEYVFHLIGSNNNGIWNETGTTLKIIINPPWWNTWWFRIVGFALLVLLLLFIHSIRITQIKNRKLYLENKVKERTEEIERKNSLLRSQSNELNETNTLLEERQQQIEEQAEELKSANDQLVESNSRLSELNSMKDKIFTIIGHDLKNPINTIMGFSELLKVRRDRVTPEKRNIYIDNIFESSKRTYQLLESLLNWARSQNARLKFNPQNLKIAPLIMDSILLLREQALNKNITIDFENNDDENFVFCDEKMIQTVLRNLISNAIKFTNPKGEITIKSSLSERPGFYSIHIQDNGLGISEERIAQLFSIEKSMSTEGTSGETGTGLGLVLCKEFIERNKGSIWVESVVGKGTTFSFTIPLANPV